MLKLDSTEPADLASAVRGRSWDWLFTLQLTLGVDLHLVDRYGSPVLTSTLGGPNAVQIGRLLATENSVRTAVLTAARSVVPQSLAAQNVYVACLPVTAPRTDVGVLVVARSVEPGGTADARSTAELDRVAEWLSSAVQAHLASGMLDDSNNRISALLEVLRAAAAAGSHRHLILTWAEAMAIWHDLEVHAYVDTMHGYYVHEAALPGADVSMVPASIPAGLLDHSMQLVPLSGADTERLNFTTRKDVVIWKVGGTPGWLLAVCGSLSMQEGPTLRSYVRLLEDSMASTTLAVLTRCLESLTVQLFQDDNDVHHHAEQAMKTLRDALDLCVASLTVRSASGAPLIVVGEWQRSASMARDPSSRLVVLRHRDDQYSLALGVVKADDHHITPQDTRVVEKAADLLELWAQRLLHRGKGSVERRAVPRRFDLFVEELAAQALERQVPVAGMVIQLRPRSLASMAAHECVARLRNQMRAYDLVGLLSEATIGLLLHNASEADAPAIEGRVRQIMQDVDGVFGTEGIVIGTVTRTPGERPSQPLLAEARARAAQLMTMDRPS